VTMAHILVWPIKLWPTFSVPSSSFYVVLLATAAFPFPRPTIGSTTQVPVAIIRRNLLLH